MVTVTAYVCHDTARGGGPPDEQTAKILAAIGQRAAVGDALGTQDFPDPPKIPPPNDLQNPANPDHDPKHVEAYRQRVGGMMRYWSDMVASWAKALGRGRPVRWQITGHTDTPDYGDEVQAMSKMRTETQGLLARAKAEMDRLRDEIDALKAGTMQPETSKVGAPVEPEPAKKSDHKKGEK